MAREISAIILAGGRGGRLGRDKATLMLGDKTLLQRSLCLVRPLSDDPIVVIRRDQDVPPVGARTVRDVAPYDGVLAGLAAGLLAARHPWSMVVACDMPFVVRAVFDYMLTLTGGYDVVVPSLEVGLEPLHALYHRRCLPAVERGLAAGHRRVVSFYPEVRVRLVPPSDLLRHDSERRSFFNINTMADLERARGMLRRTDAGRP